ncbi:MAG: ATP-binding cassette domain-containing protein, partial [Prosthecobacter sp.]
EDNLYLATLYEYLETPVEARQGKAVRGPRPEDGIRFEDVSFVYPGSDAPVLTSVNLHIRPGSSLALVGENGSGKTTLIKLLTRLYRPTSGRIMLEGIDLAGMVKEMQDTLVGAKTQLNAMKMKEINENLVVITDNVRVLTGNAKLTTAIDNLDAAMASFDSFAKKADAGIDPVLKDFKIAMQQASAGLAKLEEASADISKVTNPRAPVLMRLQNVLEEAERASRAIKELANDLKQNPNALLLGKDTKP